MQRTLCHALFLVSASVVMQAQTAVVPPAFPSGTDTPLGQSIHSVIDTPAMSRAHWGIAVTTMEGTPLYGFDEGQLFRPASNAKLFTTAAAMALLGPETRVTTVVSADAPPDPDGLILGDITIHGAGDANLSGRHLPYESPAARKARLAAERPAPADGQDGELAPEAAVLDDLAAQVAAKGVKKLTGAVRGDQGLWRGPSYADTWDKGDAVWGYGAAVSALEFNDGQVELTVNPGAHAGEKAWLRSRPGSPFVQLPINQVTTIAEAKDAEIGIDARPFPGSNVVTGTVALGHPDTEEIAVQDPGLFATSAFAQLLLQHGIGGSTGAQTQPAPPSLALPFSQQVRQPIANLTAKPASLTSPVCGRDFGCGFVLAQHVSPTLAEDVTVTLKVSQNLHAEMLLRRLGRAYGSEGSFAQGARVVRQWLLNAGLDGDDFVFYDGSGLSGHDLVTPRATARLLAYAAKQTWFAPWKAALPVGGVDGSLAGRFTEAPLKGNVFAKTGTLGESLGLSGYVVCASGKTVIFSIFADTHAPSEPVRAAADKIVAAIAASN